MLRVIRDILHGFTWFWDKTFCDKLKISIKVFLHDHILILKVSATWKQLFFYLDNTLKRFHTDLKCLQTGFNWKLNFKLSTSYWVAGSQFNLQNGLHTSHWRALYYCLPNFPKKGANNIFFLLQGIDYKLETALKLKRNFSIKPFKNNHSWYKW